MALTRADLLAGDVEPRGRRVVGELSQRTMAALRELRAVERETHPWHTVVVVGSLDPGEYNALYDLHAALYRAGWKA